MIAAAPFLGEFGWEVAMWAPWLRWVRKNTYRANPEFGVYCRKGHEHLYHDFATDIIGIQVNDITAVDCVSAWVNGVRLRKRDYEEIVRDHLSHHLDLFKPRRIITPLELSYNWPAKGPPRLLRSEHITYGTPKDKQDGWIAIHARNCPDKQPERDWPLEKWTELVSCLGDHHVIAIGTRAHAPVGTEDLRNFSIKDDVLAISKCQVMVGPSSGPMPLANACGTSALWWSGNLKDISRYKKWWNPWGRKNRQVAQTWDPSVNQVLDVLQEFLSSSSVLDAPPPSG